MINPKIKNWEGKKIWLVGCSTGIGAALAEELHKLGAHLALSARNGDAIRAFDLENAIILPCDVTDSESVTATCKNLSRQWQVIDLVIYLAGDYSPMSAKDIDAVRISKLLDVNFLGAVNITSGVLDNFHPKLGIAYVSSIAGYHGLPLAMAYGPGKAALTHFAQCLWFDFSQKNQGVWIINPGFVTTRLTDKNEFSMPALISTQRAAREIIKSFSKGHFEIHFPKRFTRLIKLLSHLPYSISLPLVRRLTHS